MEKEVTVIVPTYNRANLLTKTIPSYLQPEVAELIIIDDCSSDNTKEIVKNMQEKYPQIRYIRNEKNSKQTFSKNIGIKNASTEYIYFGDDDSVISKDTINKLLSVVKSGKADIAGARAIYMGNFCGISQKDIIAFDNWCKSVKKIESSHIASFEPFESHFDCCFNMQAEMTQVPFLHACMLCRQADAASVLFDTNYKGSAYREETDFCIGLLKLGRKLVYVPSAVQINLPPRISGQGGAHSDGRDFWVKSAIECNKYFFNKHWDFIKKEFMPSASIEKIMSDTERQIKNTKNISNGKFIELLKRFYWKFLLLRKYGERNSK